MTTTENLFYQILGGCGWATIQYISNNFEGEYPNSVLLELSLMLHNAGKLFDENTMTDEDFESDRLPQNSELCTISEIKNYLDR